VFDRYNIVSEDDLRAATARTTDYVAAQETVPTSVVDFAAERAVRRHGPVTDNFAVGGASD